MTQYIDKSALVAEINKRIIDAPINNIWHQRVLAYNDVKDIISILGVKEVDLEEEIYNFWDKNYRKIECGVEDIKLIGEHFFELGLKAQKEAV